MPWANWPPVNEDKKKKKKKKKEEEEEEEATPLGLLMKHNGALTNCNGVSARGTTM